MFTYPRTNLSLSKIVKMQLSKSLSALVILLAAAVEAAPAAPPVDSSANKASPAVLFKQKRDSINDCDASTFVNRTSTGSPTVADCLQITYNIAGGGMWTVSGADQHQLVQYGTCAFGVQPDPHWPDDYVWHIGNQDIIDLIHDSVNQFQWNGLVGSLGEMECQVAGSPSDRQHVLWGLYHT